MSVELYHQQLFVKRLQFFSCVARAFTRTAGYQGWSISLFIFCILSAKSSVRAKYYMLCVLDKPDCYYCSYGVILELFLLEYWPR